MSLKRLMSLTVVIPIPFIISQKNGPMISFQDNEVLEQAGSHTGCTRIQMLLLFRVEQTQMLHKKPLVST